MALIVEDGTGLVGAESYVSDTDASTYLTSIGNPGDPEWTAASVGEREIALRQATQYLNSIRRDQWRGTRKTKLQALAWPRAFAVDDDNFPIADDAVPLALERATAEAAWRFIKNSGVLIPDYAGTGDIKRRRSKVGSLEDEVEFLAGSTPGDQQVFPVIELLIAGLVDGSAQGTSERG